jgi:hypothetical protein
MHFHEAQPAAAPIAAPSMGQTVHRLKCTYDSCRSNGIPEKKGYCPTHYNLFFTSNLFDKNGGSRASEEKVDYNYELPVPGVVIKEDELYVEGISMDIKKFNVCLRVGKTGLVSLLFYPEKRADTEDFLMGGFVLRREVSGQHSATCVETFKSQPKELAFCLRCDFNGL